MRATVTRITLAGLIAAAMLGCRSGTGGMAWNNWTWGKKKETELASAPPSQYPTRPSQDATPTPPSVQMAGAAPYVTPPGGTSMPGYDGNYGASQPTAYGVAGNGMYNPAGSTAGAQYGPYDQSYGQAAPTGSYAAPPQNYAATDPYGTAQAGYNTGGAGYTAPPAAYGTAQPYAGQQPYAAQPYAGTTSAGAYDPNMATADNRNYYAPTAPATQYDNSAPTSTPTDRYGEAGGASAAAATTPAYQPGTTGYEPGATGYQPGNTGYQPAGVPPYQPPTGAYPSSAPAGTGATPSAPEAEATPYRPGGTGDYVPRTGALSSGTTTSGSTTANAGYDATGSGSAMPAYYTPPASAGN